MGQLVIAILLGAAGIACMCALVPLIERVALAIVTLIERD